VPAKNGFQTGYSRPKARKAGEFALAYSLREAGRALTGRAVGVRFWHLSRVGAMNLLGNYSDPATGRSEQSRWPSSTFNPMRAARRYMAVVAIVQLAVQGSGFVIPSLAWPSRAAVGCTCQIGSAGECHCKARLGEGCSMCRRAAEKGLRCPCGSRGLVPTAILRAPSDVIAVMPQVVALPFEQLRAAAPEPGSPFAFDFASVPLTPPPRA
jgi:hypothetical protein